MNFICKHLTLSMGLNIIYMNMHRIITLMYIHVVTTLKYAFNTYRHQYQQRQIESESKLVVAIYIRSFNCYDHLILSNEALLVSVCQCQWLLQSWPDFLYSQRFVLQRSYDVQLCKHLVKPCPSQTEPSLMACRSESSLWRQTVEGVRNALSAISNRFLL